MLSFFGKPAARPPPQPSALSMPTPCTADLKGPSDPADDDVVLLDDAPETEPAKVSNLVHSASPTQAPVVPPVSESTPTPLPPVAAVGVDEDDDVAMPYYEAPGSNSDDGTPLDAVSTTREQSDVPRDAPTSMLDPSVISADPDLIPTAPAPGPTAVVDGALPAGTASARASTDDVAPAAPARRTQAPRDTPTAQDAGDTKSTDHNATSPKASQHSKTKTKAGNTSPTTQPAGTPKEDGSTKKRKRSYTRYCCHHKRMNCMHKRMNCVTSPRSACHKHMNCSFYHSQRFSRQQGSLYRCLAFAPVHIYLSRTQFLWLSSLSTFFCTQEMYQTIGFSCHAW